MTEPQLRTDVDPVAATETDIVAALPFGERGEKLQRIGYHWSAHRGEPMSVKQVADVAQSTSALVKVFIDRHEADFESKKEGRATLYTYTGQDGYPETRTGRCEHEKKRKAKAGTCKVCPPVAS